MANINNSKEEINMPAEKKNGETKGVKGRHVFFYLLYRALIEGDFETVILSYCEGLYPQPKIMKMLTDLILTDK